MAKRSESRKKTELIQVRATPEEKIQLKARAAEFGVSVGELCRSSIFNSLPESLADQNAIKELAALRADLGRMGGLLKGWLANSFDQPAPTLKNSGDVIRLRQEIEATRKLVVEAVSRVSGKAGKQ